MSIEAKPWPSGGSVVDASETTKGIIRIATSAEAATGTDDLTAMTPLTVKERIDAALVGGVQYQGTFDATAGTPSIANAEKGDLYIIDTAGTIYGQTWAIGDHLLINADMGGVIDNAKIDKVDNTDAVTSVNTLTGAVVLSADDIAADHTAVNYTATNSNIDGHLSGIDTALASAGGNQINDIVTKTASSFTAESNYIYVGGYTSGTQTVTMPDASASTKGDIIGFSTLNGARSIELVSSDGTTNDLLNISNATKGGTNGALAITVDRQISWFVCDAVRWRETNAAISTVATTGAYSDLSGTPTLATVATTGAYSDLSGTPTLATVATTGAYSDLSGTPTVPADLDDLSDVTITGTPASGEILEVNGSNQFVNVAKSSINLSSFNDDLTYIGAVVEDTTPQLGGPLDVNGQAITSASNGDVTINPDGTGDISIGADMIPDADATHTIGDENNRFISAYTDINGAIRFKAKNDSGGVINKGQAVYIKGVSGTVPTVDLAQANSSSTMPAFGLALANSNDQADVEVITFGNLTDYNTTTYSLSANNTVYVSASTAGGLTNSAPTGEANLIQNIGRVVRADASAGIIKVGGAGRSNATPNLNNGNIFLGNASNQAVSTSLITALGSVDVSALNDDGTYRLSTAGLNDVSDVSFTAGAGIDNYVLTYDNGTSSWGAEPVPSASAASETVAGVIEIATNAEATAGTATDKALVPSNLSSVGTSQLNNNAGFISDISGESLNDLSDVSFTAGAGIDNYVLTYDNGTSSWGAEAAPTASAASETVAGVIEIATNAETATGTATDKALVPSNISSIDLSQANNTTSAFISGISGESLNDLSDVSFTAGAGIDNYVLTYDNGTSSWGAEPASGGGGTSYTYQAVTSASSPVTAQAWYHYSVDASGGAITINLPALSSVTNGDEIRVKIRDAANDTTIDGNSTETIDGSQTQVLGIAYSSLTLVAGSTEWEII